MSETKSRFVVSADWLQSELGKADLRVLDASFYLPAQKRDADAEYAAGHIPGAIRFDQDKIADHSTSLPHDPLARLFRRRSRPARHQRERSDRRL